jgi:hypothetical protein
MRRPPEIAPGEGALATTEGDISDADRNTALETGRVTVQTGQLRHVFPAQVELVDVRFEFHLRLLLVNKPAGFTKAAVECSVLDRNARVVATTGSTLDLAAGVPFSSSKGARRHDGTNGVRVSGGVFRPQPNSPLSDRLDRYRCQVTSFYEGRAARRPANLPSTTQRLTPEHLTSGIEVAQRRRRGPVAVRDVPILAYNFK